MDKLLNPDTGLMIWTVVTFACVVIVLGRFAWKPILEALEAREEKIRQDLKSAEESRLSSEKLKSDYARQISEAQSETRALLSKAHTDAQRLKDDMLRAAQDESAKLLEKTRAQLAEEQRRLIGELREEVVGISVKMAEKLLDASIDKKVQEKVLQKNLYDLEKNPGGLN